MVHKTHSYIGLLFISHPWLLASYSLIVWKAVHKKEAFRLELTWIFWLQFSYIDVSSAIKTFLQFWEAIKDKSPNYIIFRERIQWTKPDKCFLHTVLGVRHSMALVGTMDSTRYIYKLPNIYVASDDTFYTCGKDPLLGPTHFNNFH